MRENFNMLPDDWTRLTAQDQQETLDAVHFQLHEDLAGMIRMLDHLQGLLQKENEMSLLWR